MTCRLPGSWEARRREIDEALVRFHSSRRPAGAHLSLYDMAIKRNAQDAFDELEAWCRQANPRRLRRAAAHLSAMRRFVRKQDGQDRRQRDERLLQQTVMRRRG